MHGLWTIFKLSWWWDLLAWIVGLLSSIIGSIAIISIIALIIVFYVVEKKQEKYNNKIFKEFEEKLNNITVEDNADKLRSFLREKRIEFKWSSQIQLDLEFELWKKAVSFAIKNLSCNCFKYLSWNDKLKPCTERDFYFYDKPDLYYDLFCWNFIRYRRFTKEELEKKIEFCKFVLTINNWWPWSDYLLFINIDVFSKLHRYYPSLIEFYKDFLSSKIKMIAIIKEWFSKTNNIDFLTQCNNHNLWICILNKGCRVIGFLDNKITYEDINEFEKLGIENNFHPEYYKMYHFVYGD